MVWIESPVTILKWIGKLVDNVDQTDKFNTSDKILKLIWKIEFNDFGSSSRHRDRVQ